MIVGLGIDLVDVERFRAVRERWGDRFLRRVFTEGEIAECLRRGNPDSGLAARFAAKEAGMKALRTGWSGGVGWRDFEVVSASSGAPHMEVRGAAAQVARDLGVGAAHLSLSHDAGVAGAVVVFEKVGGTKA